MPNSPDHPDKIPVEFIEPDGNRRWVELPQGQSLLDGALDATIQGAITAPGRTGIACLG